MENAAAVHVRTALLADIPALVSLTEMRQGRAFAAFPEHFEPISASTLGERLRSVIESFANGTAQNGSVCMVAERRGDIAAYALISLVTAPPVYAPGGPVGFIGSYTARDDDADATAANALLETATAYVKNLGAVCVVVPCAAGEIEPAKATLLVGSGFYVASEWHCFPIDVTDRLNQFGRRAPDERAVRDMTVAHIPVVVELAEEKRKLYETFAPIFWRNNPDGKENQTPYLVAQMSEKRNDKIPTFAFVAPDVDETLDGFIIVRDGYADDFTVRLPNLWATVGRDLLRMATRLTILQREKPRRMLIVCGAKDEPKHAMLASERYHVVENWWVRDFV